MKLNLFNNFNFFIIFVLIFLKPEVILSNNNFVNSSTNYFCDLKIKYNSNLKIHSNIIKNRKKLETCEINVITKSDNLIKLKWYYKIKNFHFQNYSKKKSFFKLNCKKQKDKNWHSNKSFLITNRNYLKIRVDRNAKNCLKNFLIKVNNLKKINLNKFLNNQTLCFSLSKTVLSFKTDFLSKTLNLSKKSNNCEKIIIKENLLKEKKINLCNQTEKILLKSFTKIKIYNKNDKLKSKICLSINEENKKKLTKRNFKFFDDFIDENDDFFNNCITLNNSNNLYCLVYFKQKLNWENANQHCNKFNSQKNYIKASLAKSTHLLNFAKQYLARKINSSFDQIKETSERFPIIKWHSINLNNERELLENKNLWISNNQETSNLEKFEKNFCNYLNFKFEQNNLTIILMNNKSCQTLLPYLCELEVVIKKEIITNYNEKIILKKKDEMNYQWQLLNMIENLDNKNNIFNYTYEYIGENNENNLELLITSLNFQAFHYITSCNHTYVEILVSNNTNNLLKERFCGNWINRIKLLKFIGKKIIVNLVSITKFSIIKFQAQIRLIENLNQILNSNLNEYFCPKNGNFFLYANKCYMVNFYPQVSFKTAQQVCNELNSELISIPLNFKDFYFNINLLKKFLLKEENKIKYFNGDFWFKPIEDCLIKNLKNNFNLNNLDLEWIFKIDKLNLNNSSCLILNIDDYYLINQKNKKLIENYNYSDKIKFNFNKKIIKNYKNLIDFSFLKKINCNQKGSFICSKTPCIKNENCENLIHKLNQTYEEPNELILISKNFPDQYLNSIEETININVKNINLAYIINILNLDIEYQKNCLYDYLSIQSKNKDLRFCDNLNVNNQLVFDKSLSLYNISNKLNYITESGESFKIIFKSDYSIKKKGFKIKLNKIILDWCIPNRNFEKTIQLTYEQSKLTFQTPGYPFFILPDLNCSLIVNAESSNHKVLIEFEDVNLNDENKIYNNSKLCNYLDDILFEITLDKKTEKKILICSDYVQKLDDILLKHKNAKQFVSYDSKLFIKFSNLRKIFGENVKGLKFTVSSILWNDTIKTLIPLEYNEDLKKNKSLLFMSFGKFHLINYPFKLPTGLKTKIFLKAPINYNIELRTAKNYFFSKKNSFDCIKSKNYISIKDEFLNFKQFNSEDKIWNLCYMNSSLENKEEKLIKSYLNFLKITLNDGWTSEPFYYRIIKDENQASKNFLLENNHSVIDCDYYPCENGGQCLLNNLTNNFQNETIKNFSTCNCKESWYGLFCHLKICDLKPCLNNGTCIAKENEIDYDCQCKSGFTGNKCTDTVAACDRGNPCTDRNSCLLINGQPQCCSMKKGKNCQRIRIRINYKPLNERMLEEPFWLGLIAVSVVLFFISLIYLLKKKFAERIEQFFAEEIERSKAQTIIEENNLPRTGSTSSPQFLIRSPSSIIFKLNNYKKSKWITLGGNLSDTETRLSKKIGINKQQKKDIGYFSDTEFANKKRFPALLFFSQKIVNSTSAVPFSESINFKTTNSKKNYYENSDKLSNKSLSDCNRRNSFCDFVLRKNSNQLNNIFKIDLKQAKKLIKRKNKKSNCQFIAQENLYDVHQLNKNFDYADDRLLHSNLYPKIAYNNENDLLNSSSDKEIDLNKVIEKDNFYNFQIITENSQEEEPILNHCEIEINNLKHASSLSSIEIQNYDNLLNEKDLIKKIEDTSFECSSINIEKKQNWLRSQSEQKNYNFDNSEIYNYKNYLDLNEKLFVSSKRNKFANYKQRSCHNLNEENFKSYNDSKEKKFIDVNNLFVNSDYLERRLSAPTCQKTNDSFENRNNFRNNFRNNYDFEKNYSQQKLYQPNVSPASTNKCIHWNTIDNSYSRNLPCIFINDEKQLSLDSYQMGKNSDKLVLFSNFPCSTSKLDEKSNNFELEISKIQKSYSTGNNNYENILSSKRKKLLNMRSHNVENKLKIKSLKDQTYLNPIWLANASSISKQQKFKNHDKHKKIVNYSDATSSSDEEINKKSFKSYHRRHSPNPILPESPKLLIQKSLPTPPLTKFNSLEMNDFCSTESFNKEDIKFYNKKMDDQFHNSRVNYPHFNHKTINKQIRSFSSAENRDNINDNFVLKNKKPSKHLLANQKFIDNLSSKLYSTQSLDTDSSFLKKKDYKQMNFFIKTTNSPSSSQSLSDLSSDTKWRNKIKKFSSKKKKLDKNLDKFFSKNAVKNVGRSNSDDKKTEINMSYSKSKNKKKSKSLEKPNKDEYLNREHSFKTKDLFKKKSKKNSKSDTALVD